MRPPEIDYEQVFEGFWKPLVATVHADGSYTLGEDAVKRELADYHAMMENTEKVFDELTYGRISKPHTMAFEVIAVVRELEEKDMREAADVFMDDVRKRAVEMRVPIYDVEELAQDHFGLRPRGEIEEADQ